MYRDLKSTEDKAQNSGNTAVAGNSVIHIALFERLNSARISERLKKTCSALMRFLVALLCGVAGGVVGGAFHFCLEHASEIFDDNSWLVFLLPAGGVLIVFLYRISKVDISLGTNKIIESVRSSARIPYLLLPLIFLGTALTILFGGSSGREGAALQMGGVIGEGAGQLFRRDSKDIRLAVLCGMSAMFAAVFGTPMTAVVFSIEVVSVGAVYFAALLPCLISSYTGYFVSRGVFGTPKTSFVLSDVPKIDVKTLIVTVILAALCGLVSILFCFVMKIGHRLQKKFISNDYTRAIAGGFAVVALTLLFGSYDYNGAGMDVIFRAISGSARYEAFLVKMMFTAVTLGAGYKGGEIFPTFFVGATFGCAAGTLLGLPGGFGAAIGLCATFCGVVNCPIASLFLAFELFGGSLLPVFFVAIAVSYVTSGYFGLYDSQKILYSKYRLEFIDRKVG